MKKKLAVILVMVILTTTLMGILALDESQQKKGKIPEYKAKVLSVDNKDVQQNGLIRLGCQWVDIEVLEGEYKGRQLQAINSFVGQLDYDNIYYEGDIAIVAIKEKNDKVMAQMVDLYRQPWELYLFIVFIILLVSYAGLTGLKALFSFVATLFVIWKFLIPQLLEGRNPLVIAALVLIILSAVIIFSVAGFTKKGLAAFLGTVIGLMSSVCLTLFFGSRMGLHGMTSAFAQTLVISGHLDLNMRYVFYAAILIGASGAAMDIAMDVSASMVEVKSKKPDISLKELITSGFNVGRAVIGTMTTTLLLAYTGGYLTLLMLFYTKESTFTRMMNLKIVAAEVMRTLVGSIGLVLVAPITAVLAALFLTGGNDKITDDINNEITHG